MSTKSLKIDTAWKKAILVAAGGLCIFASWSFTKWGMASSAAVRADDVDVAEFVTSLAPDDPQTHYSAAVLLEKSFEPGDIQKSLNELEVATGLAPENYLYWLDLGRARERNGDTEGAERALRRALELAPNHARVQWALGNALLRQGRVDEAFGEIQKAVAGDPTSFANPAAVTAWQFFDHDIGTIRRFGAGSIQFDTALTALLVREKRLDEAVQLWKGLPVEERRTSLRETGTSLVAALLAEKRFRSASEISAGLAENGESISEQVGNGGFEAVVKPTGSGPFEWTIAPGLQPQIVLSSGQKHGGNNSLLLVFNSNDGKEFRSVSQLVAVQPNTAYELEIFYRADVKTNASFKWEIVDASDGKQLAVSDVIANRADWSPLQLRFTSSQNADGITLRLTRDNCGQICPVTGSIGFDDITLRRAGSR
ncbi:MAG TPA: tetratricopeptide repeat protein [Pyrinomonadaceae bacterium]|nr:tetratricopeptide repeat protein [Pyrinomonadaceae bacterium]